MRDSTIRLLIQGGLAIVALVGLIIVGAIQGDSPVVKVLEFVLIAAVGFFLGHQSGGTNGHVRRNGD